MPYSYLTSHDVAKMFMVTPVTVRQWVQKGLLQGMSTAGGHLRFTMQQIEVFARKRGLTMIPLEDKSLRILVVDDDKDQCLHIKDLLTKLTNAEIDTAYDGFEAGWKLQLFKPNVVLLDLTMPGMDGYEVCRLIKSEPQTKHIRVIAMTGFKSKAKTDAIIEAGAEECLPKPVTAETLAEVIGAQAKKRA